MRAKIHIVVLFVMYITTASIQAQDWPELNYYAQANAMLSEPKANENRVVFLGNSITQGWIYQRPEFFEGKSYINRGLSGQTTPQMLVRFRQDVVGLQPKVVVILAGTNDIAGNTGPTTLEMILDNLASMTEIARSNGIRVILCSVLPADYYPWRFEKNPQHKIPALNAMIKAYAQTHNVYYLDYFSALTNSCNGMDGLHSYDGVHLNEMGYKVIEPLVEQAIKEVLSKQ
ncbi:MAG: acylhydrolase [Flavobacteriales bacterium]|nr:acylhydrolase [Flavobacteriales bacterium]